MKSNQAAFRPERRSFRQLLREELARRCTANSQYSLRAFARDLETDHSTLSQLMRGRRTLTEKTIRKTGALLALDEPAIEGFVRVEAGRVPRPENEHSVQILRELTEDTLAIISGYEHYAILELTHLDEFRPDVSWIARVLGLEPDSINIALQRLLRLGLLKMVSPEEWRDCTGDVTNLLEGVAYEAVRRLSERARARTLESELGGPASEREFSSTTIAVDRRQLAQALRILAEARTEILRILGTGERRDSVYQLETSLFPLTRIDPNQSGHGHDD